MTVDPKIKEAIEAAVVAAGQDSSLAPKLIQWFEAIASGSEQIADQQSAYRHLELLYEATKLPVVLNYAELDEMLARMDKTEENL